MDSVNKRRNNIFYIIRYIWRTERKYLLFGIPKILLNAIEPFVMVIFPKIIIDLLMYSNSEHLVRDVMYVVAWMTGIHLAIKLLLTICNNCMTNAFNSFTCKHSLNIAKKIMSLEYKNVEDPKVLDLFQRSKNVDYCEEMYTAIANIISNVITSVGLVAILLQLQIGVIFVIVIVVLVNVLCNRKTQQYNYRWHVDAAPYNRTAEYLMSVMHGFEYGKEVRIYNLEEYLSKKYETFSNKYLRALYGITIKFLRLNLITSLVNVLQEGALYAYLAYRVIKTNMTIGSFTMLLTSVKSLTECLISISGSIVSLSKCSYYIDEFCHIMSLPEQKLLGDKDVPNNDEFLIEFRNVSFKYPNTEQYVLKNINAKISSKDKLSVVGTNGSGKTTFIKLILRLYEPTSGEILFNGIKIQEIDYSQYIKLFASVFQDYKLFAYSIKENIAMSEEVDDALVELVAKQTKLEDKINSLPEKGDTIMYRFLEQKGIELSGGEKQKLVISRALYKQTPILILDEPTAALDPLMEYEIYKCINETIHDKCVVFISHRLSITKYCNNIMVFDMGEIVQQGTHEELMKQEGKLYHEMYSKQAEFYD